MSDVRLDGDFVIAEGTWTKLRTLDLMLDAPSRRSNSVGERRALVHDPGDGLTANWANDYPGGVTVNGTRRLRGYKNGDWIDVESRVTSLHGTDLMLDSPGRRSNTTLYRRALVHDFHDGLTLNWNGDYPGGVTINGHVSMPGGAVVAGTDVAATLASLTAQIAALQERVTALEAAQ